MNWRSCIKTGTLDQLLLLFLKFSQMDLRCWTKSWFSNLLGIDHRGATRRPERSELSSVSLEGWVMAMLGTNLLELEFVVTCLTIQVLRCCSAAFLWKSHWKLEEHDLEISVRTWYLDLQYGSNLCSCEKQQATHK